MQQAEIKFEDGSTQTRFVVQVRNSKEVAIKRLFFSYPASKRRLINSIEILGIRTFSKTELWKL